MSAVLLINLYMQIVKEYKINITENIPDHI